jgi:hypothetical protein
MSHSGHKHQNYVSYLEPTTHQDQQSTANAHTAKGCQLLKWTHSPRLLQPVIGDADWNRGLIGLMSFLALELFQMLCLQAGMGMAAVSICLLSVRFYHWALSSKAKSLYINTSILPPVNGILLHAMLSNVVIVLVKTVPWLPRLILSWVTSETHSHKNLHSLRDVLGPCHRIWRFKLKQVHPTRVQNCTWCQHKSSAPPVNTGLILAVLLENGGRAAETVPRSLRLILS